MKSLDTNVLVRFFVDDLDDPQAMRHRPAATAATSERAFVAVTVQLEFEGVLRGFYAFTRGEVARVMRALAGLQHITLEDRVAVLAALDAFEAGLDFADALHLCRSSRAASFATFDKPLSRRAAKVANLLPPVELLA